MQVCPGQTAVRSVAGKELSFRWAGECTSCLLPHLMSHGRGVAHVVRWCALGLIAEKAAKLIKDLARKRRLDRSLINGHFLVDWHSGSAGLILQLHRQFEDVGHLCCATCGGRRITGHAPIDCNTFEHGRMGFQTPRKARREAR